MRRIFLCRKSERSTAAWLPHICRESFICYQRLEAEKSGAVQALRGMAGQR